jgi:hypothetical protein
MTSKKGNGNDKSNNKCNPPFTMKTVEGGPPDRQTVC